MLTCLLFVKFTEARNPSRATANGAERSRKRRANPEFRAGRFRSGGRHVKRIQKTYEIGFYNDRHKHPRSPWRRGHGAGSARSVLISLSRHPVPEGRKAPSPLRVHDRPRGRDQPGFPCRSGHRCRSGKLASVFDTDRSSPSPFATEVCPTSAS